MLEIGIILYWIIGAIVNGAIADAKGSSIAGVIVASLLLSPLFVYLYLLAIPDLRAKRELTELVSMVRAANQPAGD